MQNFHRAKVLVTFAPEERNFQGCESSMERKFLDFLLLGNECSRGAKVLSMDFSLPVTKVLRNEKARCRVFYPCFHYSIIVRCG